VGRREFTFVGSTSTPLSFDPAEFRGLSQQEAELEVKRMLLAQNPTVEYWPEDVAYAAAELLEGNEP